ncbi:MAG: leucyl aminopeptidase [Dehalococcoidales bacterium]|jgi:leucyl aminopeptidase|nr:leucyl aminopeptidase [Dehalococcoidales bacterium]MDP7415555.1 leucyl aminopeptidase [Dehalococcoidales bacterium]
MEIKVITGDITRVKADAIIVNFFTGQRKLDTDIAALDKALDGAISQLVRQGEIKGKLNEVTVVHSLGKLPADRVVVIGLGKKTELSFNKICGAVAETCRALRPKGITSIATIAHGAGINDLSPEVTAQAVAEGALLGLYTFHKHITRKENKPGEIKQLVIVSSDRVKPRLEKGSQKGRILAEATNLARDMVNEPANYMTPTRLAETATKLARSHGLKINILEHEQMAKMKMGGMLGVARGSRQPPKFIILHYKGNRDKEPGVALIGKGITFDSGGISIKPSQKMEEMKGDMAGGAAVLAAISAIARLKPKINVVAIIPATENLPDGNALKPGDILTAMGGKTIEVISTDAEGRLVLADALGYARKLSTKHIVDAATLTGACIIALGKVCTGAFTNRQALVDKVIAAGNEAGELIWQMPMFAEYKEQNKSDVADIKNIGGRDAGAVTAAQFLAEFAEDTPWVHLDIAGTSMSDKEKAHQVKGATGVPTRTLVNLALTLAKR